MSKDPQDLINFMKKQLAKKTDNNVDKQGDAKLLKTNKIKKKGAENEENDEEELSDEEKLEKAKKESRGKAASMSDKTDMFKRLLMETTAKYVLAIALLVGSMIALIKLIPFLFSLFNGFITKFLLGGV